MRAPECGDHDPESTRRAGDTKRATRVGVALAYIRPYQVEADLTRRLRSEPALMAVLAPDAVLRAMISPTVLPSCRSICTCS